MLQIFQTFSLGPILRCLLINLYSELNLTSANFSHLELNVGYTFEQINDKIVNLMLVANQLYIVVTQPWITGQVMFCILHFANDQHFSQVNGQTSVYLLFCACAERYVVTEKCRNYESDPISRRSPFIFF